MTPYRKARGSGLGRICVGLFLLLYGRSDQKQGAQWLRTTVVQLLAADFRPVGREVKALLSGGSRVGGAGTDGRGGRYQRRDESALGGKGQAS